MSLTFVQPEVWTLDLYSQIVRQMVEEHLRKSPDAPICSVTIGFRESTVSLSYRVLDGTETDLGVGYPANGCRTRYLSSLIRSARELQQEGVKVG